MKINKLVLITLLIVPMINADVWDPMATIAQANAAYRHDKALATELEAAIKGNLLTSLGDVLSRGAKPEFVIIMIGASPADYQTVFTDAVHNYLESGVPSYEILQMLAPKIQDKSVGLNVINSDIKKYQAGFPEQQARVRNAQSLLRQSGWKV